MRRRPPWFYRQSGVIPYRFSGSEIEVLLVTSRGGKRWIIPKGIIDPGMTAVQSACKEAYEEAGVNGRPSATAVGEYRYKKWGGSCTVEVFTLQVFAVSEIWPESGIRRRQWMRLNEAAAAVKEPSLRELILRLPATRL